MTINYSCNTLSSQWSGSRSKCYPYEPAAEPGNGLEVYSRQRMDFLTMTWKAIIRLQWLWRMNLVSGLLKALTEQLLVVVRSCCFKTRLKRGSPRRPSEIYLLSYWKHACESSSQLQRISLIQTILLFHPQGYEQVRRERARESRAFWLNSICLILHMEHDCDRRSWESPNLFRLNDSQGYVSDVWTQVQAGHFAAAKSLIYSPSRNCLALQDHSQLCCKEIISFHKVLDFIVSFSRLILAGFIRYVVCQELEHSHGESSNSFLLNSQEFGG